jgi:hypothetical protein
MADQEETLHVKTANLCSHTLASGMDALNWKNDPLNRRQPKTTGGSFILSASFCCPLPQNKS